MNNHIYTVPGGGAFSRFFQCAVVPLADREFDNVYLRLSAFDLNDDHDVLGRTAVNFVKNNLYTMALYGIHDPYAHVMNYVLDQRWDDSYKDQGFLPVGQCYDKSNRIEESARLEDYRAVVARLNIRRDLLAGIDSCCRDQHIGPRTLAVHVRLTTMNLHTHYESVTIDDYIPVIERAWIQGHYDKIFVASDNHESIAKLHHYFGDIITSYPEFERLPTETIRNEQEWAVEVTWFFQEHGWHQAFYECMTLARCGALVCRESNLANMAVVFGRDIQQVHRVYLRK